MDDGDYYVCMHIDIFIISRVLSPPRANFIEENWLFDENYPVKEIVEHSWHGDLYMRLTLYFTTHLLSYSGPT